MSIILRAIRSSQIATRNILALGLRGPKKKGKEEVGLADTTDIINIYKERKDPEVFDGYDKYPIWLFDLIPAKVRVHPANAAWAWEAGSLEFAPKAKDFRSMDRISRKIATKHQNLHRHMQRAVRDKNEEYHDILDELVEIDIKAKFEKKQAAIAAIQQQQREAEMAALEAEGDGAPAPKAGRNDDK